MKLNRRFYIALLIWLGISLLDIGWQLYAYTTEQTASALFAKLWFIASAFLVALVLVEIISLLRIKKIELSRTIATTMPVNVFCDVSLSINNQNKRKIIATVYEHVPEHCETTDLPAQIECQSGYTVQVDYQIKAVERGPLNIETTELWINSLLGLIKRRVSFNCKTISKVYPNYRSIENYVLLSTDQKTNLIGIRQRQQRGDGLEFHQLREYRLGDSLRQIDWRSTNRLQKLISKEYQQERDQNIIFLLDSGRRMRTKDGDLSHFDQALNATLLVGSIALKQGDAVGLSTFGSREQFLPPKKGASCISTILNQVYDLHPGNQASDLIAAAERLSTQFKKRSLVVIVSNVRVEDRNEIKTAVTLLKRHHLVMLANMREQILSDVINRPIHHLHDALLYSQSQQYLYEREQFHQTLAGEGIITVDSAPKNLAVNMVNQYFEIKRSGRL